MDSLPPDSQAILLLTARFSAGRRGDFTPLTPTEYGRLAGWLREQGRTPKDLLRQMDDVLSQWQDPKGKVTEERLRYLMGRGGGMGIALEKWASAGIWIVTRADNGYPERLRRRLAQQAPPLLFGIGEASLLERGGLAIVGSRNIQAEEGEYTQCIAKQAAQEGMSVVSGGAKGVDQVAMESALAAEGTSLGVLSSGLWKAALSGAWRPYLRRKDLCLVSPYHPEAPFQVGQAMGRNKYVYCLADYGLVVRADEGQGGTWSGAIEALDKSFVPLFVNPHSKASGNRALSKQGARELSLPNHRSQEFWLQSALGNQPQLTQLSRSEVEADEGDLFYRVFCDWVLDHLRTAPTLTLKEMGTRHGDLTTAQLKAWLKRAQDEGHIERLGRAHRYRRKEVAGQQRGLFESEEGGQ